MSLLEVRNLTTAFQTERGEVTAVEEVSFYLDEGEILGIVGESGSGKSVTALTIMGLLPQPPARIAGGSIRFAGEELTGMPEKRMEAIRGSGISRVFQEPMTSLTPVFTIGEQMMETLRAHERLSQREQYARAVSMLDKVGIPSAAKRMTDYPHQLSGGQRQRVMIAMALACNPKLLIADEPTTALDVTIQAQILDIMRNLRETLGTAIVLITHDMGVVAENADRVVVMYAGRKVEEALVDDLFERPGHPYTKGLLGSIPNVEAAAHAGAARTRLTEIKGMVPSLAKLPPGCAFAARCGFATDQCITTYPPLEEHAPQHWVACWHAKTLMGEAA